MSDAPAQHWDAVYAQRPLTEVSWYEEQPSTSLRLLAAVPVNAGIVDVGAGESFLVDALLGEGRSDITLLDVSAEALEAVQGRLAGEAAAVSFVVADVLGWHPGRQFDAWHDRAVFHFLTTPQARDRYVATVTDAVPVGGLLVLGTFAADGPERCSGLPTSRYDADSLAAIFGGGFTLEHAEREMHTTPGGAVQPFTWVVLRRR